MSGCTPRTGVGPVEGALAPEQVQLAQGYALLHELVSKQSGLDQSLILGGGMSDETRALIREIDATSEEATEKVRSMAQAAPWIDLRTLGLPEAEAGSRRHMEAGVTRRLLFAGKDFELRLLLSQVDATGYGEALAIALEKMEKDRERREWLRGFAQEYAGYARRVEGRLAVRKGESR